MLKGVGLAFLVSGARPVAPISVVIPCNVEDFQFLPIVLNSIANQSVLPAETILIANLPNPFSDGVLLLDTGAGGASDPSAGGRRRESANSIAAFDESTGGDVVKKKKPAGSGDDEIILLSWLISKATESILDDGKAASFDYLPDPFSPSPPSTKNDSTTPSSLRQREKNMEAVDDQYKPSKGGSMRPVLPAFEPSLGQASEADYLEGGASPQASSNLVSILKSLPDLKISINQLPRLKLYIRSGQHFAGSNRLYGGVKSSYDIISFFDSDDYMHPQRIERIYQTFDNHKDLEALIHSYHTIKLADWARNMPVFLGRRYGPSGTGPTSDIVPYRDLWNLLPRDKLKEGQSEPSYSNPNLYSWWFPKDMGNLSINGPRNGHNGWLTIKKKTLMSVPYPDIRRGQDSLYNWRLIASKKNWSYLPEILGAYIIYT